LPRGCKDDVIAWAQGTAPSAGGARVGSDLDIGIVLTPLKKANRDPAYGALADLGLIWQAELEEIVGLMASRNLPETHPRTAPSAGG
jgi:hypothetical protein